MSSHYPSGELTFSFGLRLPAGGAWCGCACVAAAAAFLQRLTAPATPLAVSLRLEATD